MTTALLVAVLVLAALVAGDLLLTRAVLRRLADHEARLQMATLGTVSTLQPGAALPDFEVVTVDGRTVSSADLSHGPVVMAFLSSSCEACRDRLGDFLAVADDVGRERSLVIVEGDDHEGADLVSAAGGRAMVIAEAAGGPLTGAFEVRAHPAFVAVTEGRIATVEHRPQALLVPSPA